MSEANGNPLVVPATSKLVCFPTFCEKRCEDGSEVSFANAVESMSTGFVIYFIELVIVPQLVAQIEKVALVDEKE